MLAFHKLMFMVKKSKNCDSGNSSLNDIVMDRNTGCAFKWKPPPPHSSGERGKTAFTVKKIGDALVTGIRHGKSLTFPMIVFCHSGHAFYESVHISFKTTIWCHFRHIVLTDLMPSISLFFCQTIYVHKILPFWGCLRRERNPFFSPAYPSRFHSSLKLAVKIHSCQQIMGLKNATKNIFGRQNILSFFFFEISSLSKLKAALGGLESVFSRVFKCLFPHFFVSFFIKIF